MSRSCAADEAGLRQHRGRLMQLATATSHAASGSTKRRAYSAQHAVFKSAPTPRHSGIPGKLLSFEEVVRNDPSYTPNIEHLVFPSRRNSIPTKPAVGGGGGGGGGGGKSARARLAEVFALTRSQGSRKANSQSHEKSKSRENSITRSSISQKVGGGGSERGVSGGGEPVCGDDGNRSSSQHQQSSVSPASAQSVSHSQHSASGSVSARDLESAPPPAGSNRGPNVSVLHLRSTSEPWETAPVRSGAAGGGSRRQHSQTQQQQQQAPPPKQKSQEQSSNKVHRELSPVRWCDREVDGVYLGRSGWVQVQQRSLDDNRRMKYKPEVATSSNLHSRIKMADYHCSKSEPGKLPPPPLLRQEEVMSRPGYLPLPGETRRTKEKPSPSSLDLSHEEPITPPPVTPIISPPPAFQDTNKQRFDPAPRTRPSTKGPFLSRSNAVELSPPPSPPRSTFRTPDLKIAAALGGPIAARNRWFGPSSVHPATTPQNTHSAPPHHPQQAKSLEESTAASNARRTLFQKYGDSSSSSSSSFGFRSLDNTLAARSLAMPRLTETDSSIGGYEDGYEEDNVITLVSSSPDSAITAADRDRSRQLLRQARRSPGSDGSGKKLGSNSPSSSSSSDDGSRSPFRRATAGGQASNSHHSQANSHHSHGHAQTPKHAGGGSSSNSSSARVRRSRSLQLPERKSPVSPAQAHAQAQQAYYTSKGYPVVVKVGDDQQQRIKRHLLQQQRMSEEAQKREELLRREAEAVTEFLWSARSREAARALLSQRVSTTHQQQQQPQQQQQQQQQPSFNVVFVGGNNSKSQRSNYGQSSQRARGLQRGSSTPVSKGSSPVGGFCPNPCNPTTCDFWPHCAHRDGIYTTTKASTPAPCVAPVPPTSLRLSQSYPNTADRSDKRSRLEPNARQNYQSIRSSPASLERVDHDASPDRHNFQSRRGNSLNVSPEWRSVGPQCCQHLHPPRRTHEKPGFKVGLSDTSSSSVDAYQPRSGDSRSPADTQATCIGDKVVSPIEVNSVIVNQVPGGDTLSSSSSSSSSSEVWLTTSDRTLTKSPRRTPQDEMARLPGDLESRPGSAPGGATTQQPLVATSRLPYKPSTASSGGGTLEPQHRSLSLPKSFQAKESLAHSGGYVRSATHSPAPTLRPPTPETARTAPATPVREVNGCNGDSSRSAHQGSSADSNGGAGGSSLGKGKARFSSTPQLEPTPVDPPDPRWTNTAREWHDEKSHNDKELLQSQRNIQGSTSESVLQKFRKSFSLRFYRKGTGGSKDGDEDESDLPSHESPVPTPPALVNKDDTSEKFRFGPLIWRSSKERKKGKKAAREAKCNSGDSGIQIEMVGRTTGDSSESHDTDHLCDDDIDSPPAVRRRGTIGSDGKPSRPTSDVINQILIDKLRADLQAHALTRKGGHRNVRRTHSDLGGQRLFNWEMRNSYRRMFSTPSPIKIKPNLSPRKSNSSTQDLNIRTSKRYGIRPTGMRRCISQPLGINDLSPLMRRKPSGARNQVLSEDERGATSDDEMLSDSESSVASLNERKKSFELAMDEEVVILAEAVWDHVAMETEELAFRAGDVIEVLDTLDRDWWWGARHDQVGWFPSAFVRLRVSQEDTVEDCLAAMASGGSKQLRRRTSISLLSNDQVRSRVVRELINTERDFVKVLRDVAEGYLTECRRRNDMFSDEQIATIFGNLEQLLEFQSDFLEDLERHVDWDTPHKSCLGDTFLRHQAGFRMYSEYCNSHPLAIATLQELYQHNSYSKFFEACRLMRGLIEIPLDGYLLTPVQRICKYPLQLAELLKYTKADHMDHGKIKEALEAMRGVAILINERKRRMESLEKLAAWQQRVEGWEGEDLIETSSQLIYQGEAVRVTSGMWTNNITLFLFDHQLVYCKKDILKRNTYVYKGRIQMDTSEVMNLNDGKDPQLNVTVRHAIKVYSCVRDKWLLFCCRTEQEKSKWLDAFGQERQLVAQDLRDGLEFAPAARHLARMAAARCYRMPPSKPRGKSYKRGNSVNLALGVRQPTNGVNGGAGSHSLGRRVGTWFTFGANKKTRALGRAATLQTVHPS